MITLTILSVGYSNPPKTVKQIYDSQIGVREKPSGSNWGPEIKDYLASVNLKIPAPWCAAFVKWTFDKSGINTKITAWSPTAHNSRNIIYHKSVFYSDPKPGDVFTLYFVRLKRIAHTGFYDKRVNTNIYKSVEGNTNEAGSREGDGVYVKYRSFKSTYSITRFT